MRCRFCNSLLRPFNLGGCSIGIWPGVGDVGVTGEAMPELIVSSAMVAAMVNWRKDSDVAGCLIETQTQ